MFGVQSGSHKQAGTCCILQGIFDCWKSPWGKETFVTLPQGQSQQRYGETWTVPAQISGTSLCCSLQVDQAWEGDRDSAYTEASGVGGSGACQIPILYPGLIHTPPAPLIGLMQ